MPRGFQAMPEVTKQATGHGYRRILLPTDFSPLAEAAVPYALRVADDGAEVVVLHVVSTAVVSSLTAVSPMVYGRLDTEASDAARQQLRRAIGRVAAKGRRVRVRGLLVRGSPREHISHIAKWLHADLIVLATHGRTGLRDILMGSVAETVVRHAPCPVLAVRPMAETA